MTVTERPGNRLACPHCLSPDFLGENVMGWRELKLPAKMIDGRIVAETTYNREVYDAERVSWFCSNQGCNIDVELRDSQLVQIDGDGNPIIEKPAEQGRLDAAALHGEQPR